MSENHVIITFLISPTHEILTKNEFNNSFISFIRSFKNSLNEFNATLVLAYNSKRIVRNTKHIPSYFSLVQYNSTLQLLSNLLNLDKKSMKTSHIIYFIDIESYTIENFNEWLSSFTGKEDLESFHSQIQQDPSSVCFYKNDDINNIELMALSIKKHKKNFLESLLKSKGIISTVTCCSDLKTAFSTEFEAKHVKILENDIFNLYLDSSLTQSMKSENMYIPKELMPGITFIIQCKNGEHNIIPCLLSLYHATKELKDKCEIVLIDNMSSDRSFQLACSIAKHAKILRVYRFTQKVSGDKEDDDSEKFNSNNIVSVSAFYNWCIGLAKKRNIINWNINFIANPDILKDLISSHNLLKRSDNFSVWFDGISVYHGINGNYYEKKETKNDKYRIYSKYRGYHLKNGNDNGSISKTREKFHQVVFYDIKKTYYDFYNQSDTNDFDEYDIWSQFRSNNIPEDKIVGKINLSGILKNVCVGWLEETKTMSQKNHTLFLSNGQNAVLNQLQASMELLAYIRSSIIKIEDANPPEKMNRANIIIIGEEYINYVDTAILKKKFGSTYVVALINKTDFIIHPNQFASYDYILFCDHGDAMKHMMTYDTAERDNVKSISFTSYHKNVDQEEDIYILLAWLKIIGNVV